ncbi:MAG: 50S ribosomal protein L10 [Candidatus Paceibacterota bacterium]|jgi:large subunit ribosomal protein L10
MAKNRNQKAEIQKTLKDKISSAVSTVFVTFSGLFVNDSNQMRKSLKKDGIGYGVVKKSLLKRALTDAAVAGDAPKLNGEIAVAYGADAVAPAKTIAEFAKKFKGKLTISGGVLENRYLSAEEVVALAKIPSREVLYGKLVNVMNGPIQGFVGTLNGVTRDFVVVLNQIAKTKSN